MKTEKILSALRDAEKEIKTALDKGEDLRKYVSISEGNSKMGKVRIIIIFCGTTPWI